MTPGLIDEIVFIDLLALFLAVATVETVWYVVKKAFPNEVGDVQFFAPPLHLCDCSLCYAHLFRAGPHKL